MSDPPFATGTRATAWQTLADVYRGASRLRDRILHPSRHRSALLRLADAESTSVLIVCHGNVCRSPYMAEALRRALDGRHGPAVRVRSAGFVGPDRSPPDDAIAAAAERGLDLRSHRSRLITPEDLVPSAVVVVMDVAQRDRLWRESWSRDARILVAGDLDPLTADSRAITDPWNQSRDVFQRVYARLDRCVTTLVDRLPRE